MTALPSRTLRRGVTAVTTVAVASACTQKKRLTPYLAAVAEETSPPPLLAVANNPGKKSTLADLLRVTICSKIRWPRAVEEGTGGDSRRRVNSF